MCNSIFGVRVDVTQWKVHKKLNQNHPEHEYEDTRKWCIEQAKKEKNIADWMEYFK
jgi:predicted FMN-binding regulatory protein PaiB